MNAIVQRAPLRPLSATPRPRSLIAALRGLVSRLRPAGRRLDPAALSPHLAHDIGIRRDAGSRR